MEETKKARKVKFVTKDSVIVKDIELFKDCELISYLNETYPEENEIIIDNFKHLESETFYEIFLIILKHQYSNIYSFNITNIQIMIYLGWKELSSYLDDILTHIYFLLYNQEHEINVSYLELYNIMIFLKKKNLDNFADKTTLRDLMINSYRDCRNLILNKIKQKLCDKLENDEFLINVFLENKNKLKI
jgi:hypothetical protein